MALLGKAFLSLQVTLAMVVAIFLVAVSPSYARLINISLTDIVNESDIIFYGVAESDEVMKEKLLFSYSIEDKDVYSLVAKKTRFHILRRIKGYEGDNTIEVCNIPEMRDYGDFDTGGRYVLFIKRTRLGYALSFGIRSIVRVFDGTIKHYLTYGKNDLNSLFYDINRLLDNDPKSRLYSWPFMPYEVVIENPCW